MLACTAPFLVHAQAGDPVLKLSRNLSQAPGVDSATTSATGWSSDAARWVPGGDVCAQAAEPPWDRLTLGDALAQSLCRHPGLRQAIADVAAQSANVDLGEITLRPNWNATLAYSSARNFNSSGSAGRTLEASLGLSWALFDFGQRDASLRESRLNLSAAMASQGSAVLDAVRDLSKLYGDAVVTSSVLEAATEAESTASQTAAAAQARYEAQVGSQIDRLQAQTAMAQATLTRTRAHSDWEVARANLVLALGGDIEQPVRLAEWSRWIQTGDGLPPMSELRQEAHDQHPRLRALKAQIDGLQARLDAVRAQSRGSISLSASGGTSRNWGAAGSGNIPTTNAAVVASIPLFNGRESQALQAQVLAQKSAREAEFEAARRTVDSELWQARQALLTSRQSLRASELLLTSAESAYRVAQGRYRAGVGSMLELLNAQSSFASARQERVRAMIEQLTARTQLGLALGRTSR
ncbi:MAG: TolC family protein [Hydrogenophaga sp.]|nr:TolC family protein [Hydrogenophaga sp.]